MSLQQQMLKGMVWTSIDRFTTQFVQLIVGIVIARIITPSEYGVLGIIMIFISLSYIFVDSGLGASLVQKNKVDDADCCTVFYVNLIISGSCFLLLYNLAPFIADFYCLPQLTIYLRVASSILIIDSLTIVPISLYRIRMNFKPIAIANFCSALVSGIIGIVMAYKGYGIWALIGQTIIRSVLISCVLWVQLRWCPKLIISRKSFSGLYRFGSKLFFSAILNNFVTELNSFVIGKLYRPEVLGYYTKGSEFATKPAAIITSIFYTVFFPTMVSIKDDKEKLYHSVKVTLKYFALIVFPLYMGLAMIAEPLIRVLLTDKWINSIVILQIICLARMITLLSGININVLNAIGRSDLSLRQEIIKLAIRVVLLLVALKHGIVWIAAAELLSTFLHFFINAYYPGRFLSYGALSQIRDFSPFLIASILSSALGYLLVCYVGNPYVAIFCPLLISALAYIAILLLMKQGGTLKMLVGVIKSHGKVNVI